MKEVLTGLSTLTSCQIQESRVIPTNLLIPIEYFFLETGAKEQKFSCHLVSLSLQCDFLDFILGSMETQTTSLTLCAILNTNHNHYHLQVNSFIQLTAWHGFSVNSLWRSTVVRVAGAFCYLFECQLSVLNDADFYRQAN